MVSRGPRRNHDSQKTEKNESTHRPTSRLVPLSYRKKEGRLLGPPMRLFQDPLKWVVVSADISHFAPLVRGRIMPVWAQLWKVCWTGRIPTDLQSCAWQSAGDKDVQNRLISALCYSTIPLRM